MMKMFRVTILAGALALFAAPAFAQGPGGGRPGGFFGGRGGGAMMLRIPEVQKELKLEAPQIDLLNQVFEGMRSQFGDFRNLSDEERRKRFQQIQADQDKKIAEILDAKQMSRFKQLGLQQEGPSALARPEIATQLKLTTDQKSKVDATIQGSRDQMRALFQGMRNNGQAGSDEDRRAAFQKMGQIRTETDAKLLGILTEPQKKQWESMQGAKFTFPQFRPGGPGGQRRGNPNSGT